MGRGRTVTQFYTDWLKYVPPATVATTVLWHWVGGNWSDAAVLSFAASTAFVIAQDITGATSPRKPASQIATFTAVAPGHVGAYQPVGTIYPRGNSWRNWLADRRLKRNIEREQRQADDRDTFAPARQRTLVFPVGGMQVTGEIVWRFLQYAERNKARGRGLSKRYWTERCRAQWWEPVYYEPAMTLLAIAQRASGLQLVIPAGHQWLLLVHNARYTTGVIREHCPARWVYM